jgi:hypothetical protein
MSAAESTHTQKVTVKVNYKTRKIHIWYDLKVKCAPLVFLFCKRILVDLRPVVIFGYHADFGITQNVHKIVILFPLFWSLLLIPLGLRCAPYFLAPVTVITVETTASDITGACGECR